jgi:thiol-disulfide isomerase/thioredoxin
MALFGASAAAPEWHPIERQVAEAVKSEKVTVVHFWAPWCANCNAELGKNGWADLINANPKVEFIFVTVWHRDDDGRTLLAKHGVGPQKNFQLFQHPNGATREDTRTSSFMGVPLTWIPATWVYRKGNLYYALNYGELRFTILQQFIKDSTANWD